MWRLNNTTERCRINFLLRERNFRSRFSLFLWNGGSTARRWSKSQYLQLVLRKNKSDFYQSCGAESSIFELRVSQPEADMGKDEDRKDAICYASSVITRVRGVWLRSDWICSLIWAHPPPPRWCRIWRAGGVTVDRVNPRIRKEAFRSAGWFTTNPAWRAWVWKRALTLGSCRLTDSHDGTFTRVFWVNRNLYDETVWLLLCKEGDVMVVVLRDKHFDCIIIVVIIIIVVVDFAIYLF